MEPLFVGDRKMRIVKFISGHVRLVWVWPQSKDNGGWLVFCACLPLILSCGHQHVICQTGSHGKRLCHGKKERCSTKILFWSLICARIPPPSNIYIVFEFWILINSSISFRESEGLTSNFQFQVSKNYFRKECTEGMDTVQHTKMMPECKNVTKQNCITKWEEDENGNQVFILKNTQNKNIHVFPVKMLEGGRNASKVGRCQSFLLRGL